MSTFVGIPSFLNSQWVAMETMHFQIARTNFFFLRTPLFRIQGVPMNILAPMKNCPGGRGVQGNLNWMLGYMKCLLKKTKTTFKEIQYYKEILTLTP